MKIVVGNLAAEITQEELSKNYFDVDFGGAVMLQIKKTMFGGCYVKNMYKVTNAVNGHGINCFDEYKDVEVVISNGL